MIDKKLKHLQKTRSHIIKEIKYNKIKYVNYKIHKAKTKVNIITMVLYITGALILIVLPFTLVEFEKVKDNSIFYLIFLIVNVILTLSPIFFGFCIFKIFEWTQNFRELIEINIIYNIDFIKIVNWQFQKLLKNIKNSFELNKHEKKEKIEIIYEELEWLISYINEYSHFNSEKFEREIIFSLQREWYYILNILNSIKNKEDINIQNNNNKLSELTSKIKYLKSDKKRNTNKIIIDDDSLEYEIIYELSNSINIMKNWLNVLKKFLDITYKAGQGSKLEKNNYKQLTKYYTYIINYDDITYIADKIFFDLKNHISNVKSKH